MTSEQNINKRLAVETHWNGGRKKNCVGTKIASEIIRMFHLFLIFFFLIKAFFFLEDNILTENPEGFDAASGG